MTTKTNQEGFDQRNGYNKRDERDEYDERDANLAGLNPAATKSSSTRPARFATHSTKTKLLKEHLPMHRTTASGLTLLVLVCIASAFLFRPIVQAEQPIQVASGDIAGHVWLDTNCDGIKDTGEGDVPNTGIVQIVNTGADRVLNPGDRAQTYYTDAQGNWLVKSARVNDFDGQPIIRAVAVGKGSAALLGYKPSPPGGDNILRGPEFGYASETFQLQDGVTLQLGEIGVCPLPRVLLPVVVR